MRSLDLWRLIAALLVIVSMAATASPAAAVAVAITADTDNDKKDRQDDGDGDRGHGNDPDGVDEDNPGNSGENRGVVVATDGYTVEADCEHDPDDAETACRFKADVPGDAADIVRLVLPGDNVCAEVTDGDYEPVSSDTDARLTGYASEEGEDELELVLAGEVRVEGTGTWWVATADGVLPAAGPLLVCTDVATTLSTAPAEPDATATTPVTPTPTPVPSTGTIVVAMHTCADVPADTTGFDWFAACQPGGSVRTFAVAPVDDQAAAITGATGETGEAVFTELAPGAYELALEGGSWCHAKSDSVTAGSNVVVEAGATSTVWVFVCEAKSGV
jgi:hypothetical protein